MDEVDLMFRGGTPPEAVLAVAGDTAHGQHHACLCVGRYEEPRGNDAAARGAIEQAAAEEFAGPGNCMHMAARAHLLSLGGSPSPRP